MNQNYPEEIESAAKDVAGLTALRDVAREDLEEITDKITGEVLAATDPITGKPSFTNDRARDLAIRERCRASEEWRERSRRTEEAELKRAEAAARLERLRGEFSLQKLERRERVAAIDAAIN
jgi:hypothetical protein